MKLFIALLLSSLSFSAGAYADRESEARQFCAQFRRQPVKRQAQMARASGYTRARVLWACNEIRSGAGASSSRGGSVGRAAEQECTSSRQCSFTQQCVSYRCVDRIRDKCTERGREQCMAGEKCVSGVCRS